MTHKHRIVIDMDFTSCCSEADLNDHAKSIVSQIVHYAKRLPQESWNSNINVSWDDSFPVETYINASDYETK